MTCEGKKCPECGALMLEWVCVSEGSAFGEHILRCIGVIPSEGRVCGHEEKVK